MAVRMLVAEGDRAPEVREPWKPNDKGIRCFTFFSDQAADWKLYVGIEEGDVAVALGEEEDYYSWQPVAAGLSALPQIAGRVHVFVRKAKKRPLGDASFLEDPAAKSSDRERAVLEYRPSYVERNVILGRSEPVGVSLRWLLLLVSFGAKVDLGDLREVRAKASATDVPEELYYPALLAFLRAASYGQENLYYGGGERFGSVGRSDLQGFIRRNSENEHVQRAASEVKGKVKPATDEDPQGVVANAIEIKKVADYMKSGIELTEDTVRMGCLFCRMDRFWVVKYHRQPGTVQLTPHFPRAQCPAETPEQCAISDPDFVLMNMRNVSQAEMLNDALPSTPTAGFATLVAFHEQLQRLFELPQSCVSFAPHNINVQDLNIVAHGRKSLVLLKRSSSTVLKICLEKDAEREMNIHMALDGHQNLRRLVNRGEVNIGSCPDVFRFLELEGFGKPFGAEHVKNLEAMETMWEQAVQGLGHLHGKGVFHRDLKPDNILVFEESVLKINDFDVSCFNTDDAELLTMVGTRGFQSPSTRLPYREEDDVLSLALTFYAAKTGIAKAPEEARLHILRYELHPDFFPENMRVAVQRALQELDLD